MQYISPPQTINELLNRTEQIRGHCILSLATKIGYFKKKNINNYAKHDMTHIKGLHGQIIEKCLGADAQNKSIPDFTKLGIELKTLPVNHHCQPLESTYICNVPVKLKQNMNLNWHDSCLYNKIKKILWVPILRSKNNKNKPVIGKSFLDILDKNNEKIIRQDWEELTEMLLHNKLNCINSHFGEYLQIRPKAQNSSIIQDTNCDNFSSQTLPRGFYLRTLYTKKIILKYLYKSD